LAAKQWHLATQKSGFLFNDGLETLYRDYLQQGGLITLNFDFPQPLNSIKLDDLFGINLVKHYGLSIGLNDSPVEDLSFYLDELYFKPKKVEVASDAAIKEKTLPILPDFQTLEYQALTSYIGRFIRVERQDKKIFVGILKSVDESALVLSTAVMGGSIEYVLKPREISHIEVKTNRQERGAMRQ